MSDLRNTIQKQLDKDLRQNQSFDVVGIIPLPSSGDRMIRLQTLEEVLDDFDRGESSGLMGYVVQVRPKREAPAEATPSSKPSLESIYLPNGKLNHSYLLKNAEILFSA